MVLGVYDPPKSNGEVSFPIRPDPEREIEKNQFRLNQKMAPMARKMLGSKNGFHIRFQRPR